MVEVFLGADKIANFKQDNKSYLLDYENLDTNNKKFYTWEHRFPPYFESFLPEGYLYEIFKNILIKKYGYIDDYLIFSILSPNLEARVKFKSDFQHLNFEPLDIDDILNNDTKDTFDSLLTRFLDKNAISGVQPKTIALIKDKETMHTKEYIVKTWGDEYKYLAENEYFCLNALKLAGVEIPNIQLSKNKNFLLVENFIFKNDEVYGFEEILSLMDKNKINKYQGSYEQVSKVILKFSTNKKKSMLAFYKTVVMSFLLKNGDAHLKNFGLLFKQDFSTIEFAPAYDIVTTTAYIYKDKPALTLDGKKIWHSKDTLVKFGQKYCLLSSTESHDSYELCIDSLLDSIDDLKLYLVSNPHFKDIGQKMLDSWSLSLSGDALKEIGDDIIRTWRED